MSFAKFFQIIDKSFIGKWVDKKLNIVEHTNPDRIYIENIRQFYNIPYPFARFLCDLAVREGVFTKHFGIICPNENCGRIIKSIDNLNELPNEITCTTCEMLEESKFTFVKKEIKTIVYYKLI